MSSALEKIEEKEYYTYADYLEWDEEVRAEIINGVVYMMSTPLTIHQRIVGRLSVKIATFLEGKPCEVFTAPFRVRLFPKEDKSDDIVVVPDVVVICDPSKIDERGCNGAPDLVIEVLSPPDREKDRLLKFNLYMEARVREHWVVFPESKEIEVNIYDRGHFIHNIFGVHAPDAKKDKFIQEIIPVTVLPGLEIDAKDIFK